MGIESAPSGVTLHFLDKTGRPDGRPDVKGNCLLLSSRRIDNPLDPDPLWGSSDWLTDIIVADTPAKLSAIRPVGQGTDAFTSSASRRVFVQWDSKSPDGKQQIGEQQNCLTIARLLDGQCSKKGYGLTDHILILPSNTDMMPGHDCWKDWKDMILKLQAMLESRQLER
jgi:hypothetical protein